MQSWPAIWLHRWAVEYGMLRYLDGQEHEAAFQIAFETVRNQMLAGRKPRICCATAERLAGVG